MSRLTGFIGGSVLTSSILYLGLLQLQHNTSAHRRALRECADRLEALREPKRIPENPRPRVERPSLVETAKDAWNDEIYKLARWGQQLDWVQIRERTEEAVSNVVEKMRK